MTLLRLATSPLDDPAGWLDAAAYGPDAAAVVHLDVAGWSSDPDSGRPWSALAAAIERLVNRGVRPLGHVSLGYGTRPVIEVLAEITRWAVLPIAGLFLDHAPASPYQIGPVVHAVRMARKAGLSMIVLNPGVPVDPLYRRLEVTICTFEGSWAEYLAWSGERAEPGDGHLVFGVPASERDAAWALVAARRAGLVLLSERSMPYPADTLSIVTQ